MRRLLAAAAALAACTPEIVPGAYLCGPEGLCPEGQACDGPDNRCVLDTAARPFACGAMVLDPPGDDAPATGTVLANLACPSVPSDIEGCLTSGDAADFYQLDVPGGCTAARIEASVVYPVAFESVGFLFAAGGAAPAPAETPCPASVAPAAGHALRCFSQAAPAGGRLALGVARDGGGDCGGACRHNRYTLRLRLASP